MRHSKTHVYKSMSRKEITQEDRKPNNDSRIHDFRGVRFRYTFILKIGHIIVLLAVKFSLYKKESLLFHTVLIRI